MNIGNALVPVNFHVMDIQMDLNSSLLIWWAFMANVEAVCEMQTNKLCLTLIDKNEFYDHVPVIKGHTSYIELGDEPWFAATIYSDYGREN